MLNIRPKIKIFGLRVKVMMPVLCMGYVTGLQIFNPNLLTVNQTGFFVVHHKNIAIFPRALETIASQREGYQTQLYFWGTPLALT
jgi:hypothetical protein